MKPYFIILTALFSSCISNHYDRTESFTFSWKIGDFDQASQEIEQLAESGPKRDRMLYRMEEGAIKRLQNDFEGSIRAFSLAGDYYEKWFGVHLQSQTKISEELGSTIGSQEWKPYKSRVYERVMLRVYQALNYLQLGKEGQARAEIFKIRQAVSDAKEIWKKELDAARILMREKSMDLDNGLRNQIEGSLHSDLLRARSLVPSNLPDFVNPAAIYLEALFFLHGTNEKSDLDKARFSLRELYGLYPANPYIQEDYQQAKKNRASKIPTTYIFFETGRAPVRREKRYDIPLVFFSVTSRIPYAGIAFPHLVKNDNYLSSLEVFNGSEKSLTLPLADFDAIIAKEFTKNFPIELTKAILGSVSKGALQYTATSAVRDESEEVRAVTGVGVGALAQGLTQSDWRSWTTLPKQIQFCKIPSPASRELTLHGVGTKLKESIILKPATINLIWIRSISAQTPLRVVNQFVLKP